MPAKGAEDRGKVKSFSRVRLFGTPWTVTYQAPPSIGFSRQECWSGLPFPSPGDLPDTGIEPGSPVFQEDTLTSEPPEEKGMRRLRQENTPCAGQGATLFARPTQ